MRRMHVLWNIVRVTNADYIIYGFLVALAVATLLIPLFEPGIPGVGDSLWYLFGSFTTIGFGDYVAVTTIGRLITVVVALYGILVVALMTGIIVGFYNELLRIRSQESLNGLIDELEHLPELSREELLALSQRIRERHILR